MGAGLLGSLALAGCGAEVEGVASPSSSASSPSSAASSSTGALDGAGDLSAGLLPAEAFGPGAQVAPVTADQLRQQQGRLGGLQDVTITPEACAPGVKSIQPGLDDIAGLGAQTATVGTSTTVEVLASGEGVGAGVDDLSSTAETCPQATITAPEIGTADMTFTALDVPALGDGSAGISMTLSITGPDGQPFTLPMLLGMVRDGDRLVSLTQVDAAGGADPAAFTALLQQAFEQQAATLD
ncbi:hypothetical protein [Modestobacter marinus]|uniref:hypothetical protein n=1 Tax=Modestobacter marinus TaxID=477641 RepID=UPI001C95A7B9|nr:hypothetical protein [Modestobacter marinus]